MKLQLALDGTLPDSLKLLEQVHPYIDLVEIGTPLVFREGMHALRTIRAAYPNLPLLADFKIMDAGKEEAEIAFALGCQIVTVLGVTQPSTVQGALEAAHTHQRQIMIDLMQVSDLLATARNLLGMGCHYLCVHTAYDMQSQVDAPLAGLQTLRQNFPDAGLAIAGGINLEILPDVMQWQPQIIVVGGAITRALDPASAARQIHERINHHA